jgi:hypothetical protein
MSIPATETSPQVSSPMERFVAVLAAVLTIGAAAWALEIQQYMAW